MSSTLWRNMVRWWRGWWITPVFPSGAEVPLPVLRHAQFQLPHPRDQRPLIVPAAITAPVGRPLALARSQGLVHLYLEDLLHHFLDHRAQVVAFLHQFQQPRFPFLAGCSILLSGHGPFP